MRYGSTLLGNQPPSTQPTQAIEADPLVPWGYERRHAALHGARRYDEAIAAFTRMLSLIEDSCDQSIRGACHLTTATALG